MSIPDDPFTPPPPISDRRPLTISTKRRLDHTEPLHEHDGPPGVPLASSSTGHHTPAILIAPAGGTSTVPPGSGTKTPRRVQWNNESHIVQLEPIPLSPQTVDRTNLNAIDAALEQHRTRDGPVAARPLSQLSNLSSGDTGGEADYDYRLDVDPPQHPHGETLEPVTSQGSQRDTEPQSLHDILDTGINDHIHGGTIAMGETDGLPNITSSDRHDDMSAAANLVRVHTGKWGTLRRRVKGASAVSRAFGTIKEGEAKEGGDAEKRGGGEASETSQDAFAARYPEPGHRGRSSFSGGMGDGTGGIGAMGNGMPQMPGGASVLSSLLALYNQQNMPQSGTTSAASSRPSSIYESSDDEEEKARAGKSMDIKKGPGRWWQPGEGDRREVDSNDTPPDVIINTENRRPSEVAMELDPPNIPQHIRSQSESSLTGNSRPTPGFLSALKRARKYTDRIGSQLDDADRPKAARSGAGVWGALIQNTQNISGVATPTAATLAPAAARPGYQLTRYTLPTADSLTQASTPWRPTSRTGSRPGSRPESTHSGTAVSNNVDSPPSQSNMKKNHSAVDLRKNHSSEDMLVMKSPSHKAESIRSRSGLTLDSLGKLPVAAFKSSGHALKTGGQAVRNAERWVLSGGKTPLTPPAMGEKGGDYFANSRPLTEDERRRKEWESEKRRRKKQKEARKKQEIFIIQHVAAILARQQFLMKLARALMMFGSPSHRLETQIQATAKVLELNAQVVYLPGIMLISFGDDATHTSETKFLKQATGLDLGKLLATHKLYWNVVHDRISVEQASKDLDVLMTTPMYYSWWQTLIIGGMASSFICVVGFSGSFIDALAAAPLGALLCAIQMLAARNDMFSNVFEIAIATIISFIAAGLASTGYFCYTALVSGGVVLILPGYIVLCGALELAARNITAGAVRIGYSVIYSLFLGFGISIGAELYRQITGLTVIGANDYQCSATHASPNWYQVTPSQWWYFLACPGFALGLSLRNQQPLFARELPIMILIACAGWASNHFAARAFINRSDMTSAIGSFVVGTLGNLYGKLSKGSSFPVTVVGILFQLPSGLSNGGIFNFASQSGEGNTEAYSSGFEVAQQLVSVAIGLTVGLFVSAAITHPFGGGRRRGSGIFSF